METELAKPPASHKSAIWEHFGFPVNRDNGGRQLDKSITVCRHCSTTLKYTGNTTNMTTHIRRHHPIIDISGCSKVTSAPQVTSLASSSKDSSGVGQLRVSDIFHTKLSAMSRRAQAITTSIDRFIALDMRPYCVVENVGFKELVTELEPRYTIPSRTHFSNAVLPRLYAETSARLRESLKTAAAMALTTDGWTSRATESYVTITAHYLTNDWTLQNCVLQTRPCHESHTATKLADILIEAVKEWDLGEPADIAITTDNAANILKGVANAGFSPRVTCFAHTVNLAVQRGMHVGAMERLLSRIRVVVGFFHKSTTATSMLTAKQTLLELPCHKLINDVSTRWNSCYDMLKRYLEQQAAIFATLSSPDVRRNAKDLCTLTDSDVTNAEEIVNILKPLKTLTTLLCSAQMPTTSMILPLKEMVLKAMKVNENDPTETMLVKNVKHAIAHDISGRYTADDVVQFLQQSTALDPRFRSLAHDDSESRHRDVYAMIGVKALKLHETESLQHVPVQEEAAASMSSDSNMMPNSDSLCEPQPKIPKCQRKTAMEDLFGDTFSPLAGGVCKPLNICIDEEIRAYKDEPCTSINSDPFSWWQTNEHRFPHLAKLAKKTLSVPATSVPSERIFSTAGDIVSAERSSLSADNVDILIFLKHNMK